METENLIAVQLFCTHHHIEISFISALSEFGLIEVTTISETEYISTGQLSDLEKMIRLHYDLDINMEGIDAIYNLLKRENNLRGELNALKNRLRLYEEE